MYHTLFQSLNLLLLKENIGFKSEPIWSKGPAYNKNDHDQLDDQPYISKTEYVQECINKIPPKVFITQKIL